MLINLSGVDLKHYSGSKFYVKNVTCQEMEEISFTMRVVNTVRAPHLLGKAILSYHYGLEI